MVSAVLLDVDAAGGNPRYHVHCLEWILLAAVGGIMGFAKSGSSKSLMAGGGSASILYYVFLNLPSNHVLASTICLGISGMLLFTMGSRFMESGKVHGAWGCWCRPNAETISWQGQSSSAEAEELQLYLHLD